MEKQRNWVIDDLRGISILVMILIHTNVYFLHVPVSFITLEISQFAVVFFIFCSMYLFFKKPFEFNTKEVISYLKKRILRLIPPYYLFLGIFLLFTYIAERRKITVPYVVSNIFLTGGTDFNWLVLLFVQLALIALFISYIAPRNKRILYLYTFCSVISSLIFLRFTPLPYYRAIMWLPWSLIPIFTYFFTRYETRPRFMTTGFLASAAVYGGSLLYQVISKHSLKMYDNKYPPNMYHLSYGIMCLIALYVASQKGTFSYPPLRRIIHFFSVYSYSIFFIHVLIIYILTVFLKITFTWVTFFLSVTVLTAGVQIVLNKIISIFFRR